MKYSLYVTHFILSTHVERPQKKKKKKEKKKPCYTALNFSINSTITAITRYFNPETFLSKSIDFLVCKDVKYLKTFYLVSP